MRRLSVDIGGTFTDCFVVWDRRSVETKALTTHHNLALGFKQALAAACDELGLEHQELLSGVDSVRYATTLGTNALIERKGPRLGLLVTAGFKSVVPLSRGRGYGEGLDPLAQMDIPRAQRPLPLVPIEMIRTVRERIDAGGQVLLPLDRDDLRRQLRDLVDRGAEALVVMLTNSVVDPAHELLVQDVFLEEYPGHMLGAIPILLSHQVAGRKGEYVRAMSAILDAFLHQTMYHGLGSLALHLRQSGYRKPMLVVHNSGGMAQLNSTAALQTIHSGPVSGIAAAEHLAAQAELGHVVATDMGGTSFDIGLVVAGGIKHYDFQPVIERWLVSVPMVHLATLGAGGGSIASYEPMHGTVRIGPHSAGSDPGPACYDRGGLQPTVTDADLLLGYLDPANYANAQIVLNPKRSMLVMEALCDELESDLIETCKLIKRTVDNDMANGIATELRARGYEPAEFTLLTYGGNGPLHACGIAEALRIDRILAPPFSAVFSACGAGNLNQMHIHEQSVYLVLFDANAKRLFSDFHRFNQTVAELEGRGRDDLLRQGACAADIRHRLELDMRYGNQRVQTAVVSDRARLGSVHDVLSLIDRFHRSYGGRFGDGSQAPEAGVRINTMRVCSYLELETVQFTDIRPSGTPVRAIEAVSSRACHFTGHQRPLPTRSYDERALAAGVVIPGPAVVTTRHTTYLVEPGWQYQACGQGAVWLTRAPRQ
ncbi:MAG: hydantoinase/oxoprolinase family protein [Deltaproteobacteria bacterium]|nr:hydantoinase/oxoprolinase family protein [Deltaproteobacteria bacterium]